LQGERYGVIDSFPTGSFCEVGELKQLEGYNAVDSFAKQYSRAMLWKDE
jgi:hypothetical protein